MRHFTTRINPMKEAETQNSSLKKERRETDESLTAERDKTNKSLTRDQTSTEKETDVNVEKKRSEADQKKTEARRDADSNVETNNGLRKERRLADTSVEKERLEMDAALEKERESKQDLMNQMLEKERGRTDENLKTERVRTDSQVHIAKNQLSDEISKHSKTKFDLTSRDEFVAILSHDLRNPLGAISSSAEILLEGSGTKIVDRESLQLIKMIKRNSDTALRLISHLLDMEHMAEGKIQLKLETHNLNDILQESIESFAHAAAAKKLQLQSGTTNEQVNIRCDHDRILQVLSNLIGNAIKFTQEGGSISIKVKRRENEVQVSVHDNGPGIPGDKLEFIFDRFAQLGTKNREGLGLGLYISTMLIEAHGGSIWVESKWGEGSTFFFTLPLTSA